MAPWWSKGRAERRPCERCGREDVLHEGLCRRCRRASHAHAPHAEGPPPDAPVPPSAQTEPSHDRPWRHQSD